MCSGAICGSKELKISLRFVKAEGPKTFCGSYWVHCLKCARGSNSWATTEKPDEVPHRADNVLPTKGLRRKFVLFSGVFIWGQRKPWLH
jgi:hypothetical protein